jgi:hypothetical protein
MSRVWGVGGLGTCDLGGPKLTLIFYHAANYHSHEQPTTLGGWGVTMRKVGNMFGSPQAGFSLTSCLSCALANATMAIVTHAFNIVQRN